MRSISEFATQVLKWEQPSVLKMEYELHAEGELLATLEFRSSFGSLATAMCADGCWTFKRVGFFQTKVSIRPCGSDSASISLAYVAKPSTGVILDSTRSVGDGCGKR